MNVLLYFATTILLVTHNHVSATFDPIDLLDLTGLSDIPFISTIHNVLHPLIDWNSDDDHDFIDMYRKNRRKDVKSFEVTTDDGYILTLFHIRGNTDKIVLLLPSALDSCDIFLARQDSSLAMTLVNEGYDVWCGNTRGNRYSRQHETIDPDSNEFWDFCLDDIGHFDIPTIIDYVLKKTKQKKLSIIGHGTGAAVTMINSCMRPEYNNKIRLLIALAPAPFIYSVPGTDKFIFLLPPMHITSIGNMFYEKEIFSYNSKFMHLARAFCSIPCIGYNVCVKLLLFSIIGSNPNGFEEKFTSTFYNTFPSGTSFRTLIQFYQSGYSQAFTMYNYGQAANKVVYGVPEPPEYPLDQVTMNVAIYVGRNDRITKVSDAEILRHKLPNVVDFQVIGKDGWNHYDFVIGKTMPDELFPKILKQLKKAEALAGLNNI